MKIINKYKGFSLIELMIVVAIIGIIGAVSYPSYQKFMFKGYRGDDGQAHLAKIMDREERFYLQNNAYTSSFTDLNISSTSDDGFYTFVITLNGTPANQAYSVTATAVGAQVGDVDCATLTMSSTGQKSATAGTGGDATKCW